MFVFDTETDGLPDPRASGAGEDPFAIAPPADADPAWAGVRLTVAVGFDAEGRRHDFVLPPPGEDDAARAGALEALASCLDAAEAIVAYNGRGFDLRALERELGRPRVLPWARKLRDPFEVIRALTGSWVSLAELLAANGLPGKSADGAEAVRWWKAGERAKVLEYCAEDARLLHALVTCHGQLRFPVKAWGRRRDGQPGREQAVVAWKKLDWAAYLRRMNGGGGAAAHSSAEREQD